VSTAALVYPHGFEPCEFPSSWHNYIVLRILFKPFGLVIQTGDLDD